MSKWAKLLARIQTLSKDLRFEELCKVLESYGYDMKAPKSGSSHYTFRKSGCQPILQFQSMSRLKKFMLRW